MFIHVIFEGGQLKLTDLRVLCWHYPFNPSILFDVKCSTGHSGRHGHEFLEFEYSHGRLRYANNSNYRNDSLIRKESPYLFCFFLLRLLHLSCSSNFLFCDFVIRVNSYQIYGYNYSVCVSIGSEGVEADCRVERNHQVRSSSFSYFL